MSYVPGRTAYREVTPREIVAQAGADKYIQVPVTILGADSYDGDHTSYEKYIRAGSLLAYSSSDAGWAPLKRTRTNGAGSSTATLVVNDASFFKAADSVIVGNNAAVAIDSIVYSTDTITLASAKTWKDDDEVYVAKLATARAILLDSEVNLWNHDKTANVNKSAQAIVFGGPVYQDMILGDLEAALQDVNHQLRHILLDDYQLGLASANPPVPSQVFTYLQANLAANADVAETIIWAPGQPVLIEDIFIIGDGSPAGVDDSNTSVWTLKRNDGGSTIVAETFDATTAFPADGVKTSLGTVANNNLAANDCVTLTILNGTTADLPATLLGIKYRPGAVA